MLLQQLLHVAADLPDLFALTFNLVVQVENGAVRRDNDRLDFSEHCFQALPLLRQGGVERGEAGVLCLAETFELGEGQPLKQFLVRLNLTAEEVAHGDDEQRQPLRWPRR